MLLDIFGNPIPPEDGREKHKKRSLPQKTQYRVKIDSFYHPEILAGINKTSVFNMPLIKPNHVAPLTTSTTPFDQISYKNTNTNSIVMFYMHDLRFYSRLMHPWDYTDRLLQFSGVIGPDLSQYIDMDYATWLNHNYWNKVFMAYWQSRGVNIYPNVTWSLPDSFEYAIDGLPQCSIIAINSMGVPKFHFSKALWLKGYCYVIDHLHPTLILRYGPKISGEDESISLYLENEQLNILKNGSKRK